MLEIVCKIRLNRKNQKKLFKTEVKNNASKIIEKLFKTKNNKRFKNEYWFILRTKIDEAIHKYAEENF